MVPADPAVMGYSSWGQGNTKAGSTIQLELDVRQPATSWGPAQMPATVEPVAPSLHGFLSGWENNWEISPQTAGSGWEDREAGKTLRELVHGFGCVETGWRGWGVACRNQECFQKQPRPPWKRSSPVKWHEEKLPMLSATMAAPHPTLWTLPLQLPEETLAQAGLHVLATATAWAAQDQTPVGCPRTEVGLKSQLSSRGMQLRKRKLNLNPRQHRH